MEGEVGNGTTMGIPGTTHPILTFLGRCKLEFVHSGNKKGHAYLLTRPHISMIVLEEINAFFSEEIHN